MAKSIKSGSQLANLSLDKVQKVRDWPAKQPTNKKQKLPWPSNKQAHIQTNTVDEHTNTQENKERQKLQESSSNTS